MHTHRAEREERKEEKEEKQIQIEKFQTTGKEALPHVARIFSRRAPSGHHVANLVRVALESVAFVFLFVF